MKGEKVYVEMPPGRAYPAGYISPQLATLTGEASGGEVRVTMPGGWTQWVRKEQVLRPHEVEE